MKDQPVLQHEELRAEREQLGADIMSVSATTACFGDCQELIHPVCLMLYDDSAPNANGPGVNTVTNPELHPKPHTKYPSPVTQAPDQKLKFPSLALSPR